MNFRAICGEFTSSIKIYSAISMLSRINIRSELATVTLITDALDKLPESTTLHLKKHRFGAWKLKKQQDGSLELIISNCPFWGMSTNKKIHQPRLLCRKACDQFIRLLKHKYNVIEST